MKKITFKCPTFFSIKDEYIFFEWIDLIPSISKIEGVGTNLIITFLDDFKEKSEKELNALCKRYGIKYEIIKD